MGRPQHVQGSHWEQHCSQHVLGKISVIWGLPAGSCVLRSPCLQLCLLCLSHKRSLCPAQNPILLSAVITRPQRAPTSRAAAEPSHRSPKQPPSRWTLCPAPREKQTLPRAVLIPPSFPTPNLSMVDFCSSALSIPGRTCTPPPAPPHPSVKVILLSPLPNPNYHLDEIFLDPCREGGDVSHRINGA